MSVAKSRRAQQDEQLQLSCAITILERLGIIDFNGHCSARLADGHILINSGSSVRSAITPADFVVVAPDGSRDADAPAPPKELPLHLALYAARSDVHAVVHGHPKWSTLLSCAGIDYRVTMAQGALLGPIPTFDSPRSVNDAEIAAAVAKTIGEGNAALLRSHGSVIAARDVLEATVMAIYLEPNAERQFNATLIGQPYVFSDEEIAACRRGLMQRGLFEKCWNYYLARFGMAGAQ